MITACTKSVITEVPGTEIKVELFCKFAQGHKGHHVARGTMNGIAFEVEYE